MGIRRIEKDQSKGASYSASALAISGLESRAERLLPDNEPLLFWTSHKTEPTEVDLRPFAKGQATSLLKRGGTWTGPYQGRPNLIEEIAPTIKSLVEFATPKTITQALQSLRHWWRLLDKIDKEANEANQLTKVKSVFDLTELHCQRACNENMRDDVYNFFIRIANLIRKSKGVALLYTSAPETETPERHLPPREQTKEIRFALKHAWFSILGRWETADRLNSGAPPENESEEILRKNYAAFTTITQQTGKVRPKRTEFYDIYYTEINKGDILMNTMLRGAYPDGYDIRVAYHFCLANSPWNPAVFTTIDVESDFYVRHPKDPSRYTASAFSVFRLSAAGVGNFVPIFAARKP